jgi:two-component system sensor histidine kinase/response regulator
MRLLRDTSISRKLKVIILATTSVALLIAGAAFATFDLVAFRQSMASDLSTLAKVIGTNSTAALAFNHRASAKDVLSALAAKQNVVRARIYTSDSDLFAEYVRAGESGDIALTAQQQSQVAFTNGYLIASETIDLDGETIGTVYLISNLDAFRSRLNRFAGVVAAVLFGSLLVAFLLSSKLQSQISDPISHLAKTARAVSVNRDYTIRAVKSGRDEMGMLIDAFNEMLGQIQERDARLQIARDELERRVEERTKELQDEIAEREQAVELLRRSEEHFRSLIENASDIITILDSKGTILYESPSVERVLGLTPHALMGANALELTHPDDRKAAVALLTAAIGEDGPAGPFELRFQHTDGSWRALEIIGQALRDESGAVEVIINSRDVTERKRSDAALRESEENYRTILQSIQEGYFEVDLSGTLTFFNDSLSRIIGIAAEELKGLNHREYTDPETASRVYQAYNGVFRTGEPIEGLQYEIVKPDGVKKFLETSVSLRRDSTGRISGFRGTVRDVTESRRVGEALRESEDRYRDLVENSHDLICTHDLEGRILSVNQWTARMLGYDVEAVLKMNLRDLLVPEFRSEFDPYLHAVRTQGVADGFMKVQTITGEARVIEYTNTLRSEGVAEPIVRAMAHDITERLGAERALRESEEKYRTILESIQEGYYEVDLKGNLTFFNDSLSRIVGTPADKMMGLNHREYTDPETAKTVFEAFNRVYSTGEPIEGLRYEITTLEGRKSISETSVSLRRDSNGRIVGFRGTVRDITERDKMEKEVSMLAQAIRSIHEAVVVTDPNGNIIFVNAAAVEMFGYERDEAIGKHVTVLHSARNSPEFVDDQLASAKANRWEGEMLSRRKDGTEFPIYLSASDIKDEKGQCIALIGVSQDITDRKRSIEELQKAKEAAEAASRAKSEFLANMSHEIRTPMNGIVGMTELALDTELTDEQREYLKLVKLSSDALLRVINDILDFSKIEAGRLELDHAEFSLQDNVDKVMKALAVRADQKGLELAYYLRPGVPDLIVGDSGRLQQILINLVGNAIKFTERGEVVVRIETESQTDDQVILHFCVRDTGIGVPIEKQALVFESFTQADGSTTRKYGGTGLGLAISTQLVRAMDGQIWIQSPSTGGLSNTDSGLETCPSDWQSEMDSVNPAIDGPGSMFHFTAAFALPRTSAARTAPLELSTLRGLAVLVVDDNATNRRILEVQLTGWGMIPTTAENAAEALDAIRDAATGGAPFSLALLDLHMPDVDGLELTERIRRMPEAADVKIVMMSSALRENYRKQDLGVDAYLMKPVKASELLGVIRSVLRKAAVSQNGSGRPRAISSAHPAHVLVAEDSAVNQELIKRLLAKWGHSVVIADNGKQALALLETGSFDLVLMDVQMPEINGFEATAAIRSKERGTDAHIPIIALTAHALKGDREKCIAAGMDDYISKPVQADKAFDAIEAAIARGRISNNNGHAPASALDADALMLNLDGDIELLRELAKIFATSAPAQLSAIDNAMARQDAAALARGAHTLKGSIATFQARAAVEAAAMLEKIGDSGDLSNANPALEALSLEIARVTQALHELTGGEVK